ncbi:MAG: helix-turn-helix transcriptional regulator [Lysobacterales bacterium]
MVFPRDAVEIRHPGHDPLVADSRIMTLYNSGQEYRRGALSPYGDRSMWLRFPREAVVEALIDAGRSHPALERRPFESPFSPCSTECYFRARKLLNKLLVGNATDSLGIQEMGYRLLYTAISVLPDSRGHTSPQRPSTRARHRRLANRCQALLAGRFGESLSLTDLARELATTPFHLSRVFSSQTGTTIHNYLMSLRLRAALDLVIERPDRRLTDISADLGFATPSHFSRRFRQSFGRSPGACRFRRLDPNS